MHFACRLVAPALVDAHATMQEIGDTAIQIDPVHAAAPWAAVRVILQASVNDSETFCEVLASIEKLTNLIATCKIFELQYLQERHKKLEKPEITSCFPCFDSCYRFDVFPQLARAVTTLYTNILKYLMTVLHYYGSNTALRYIKSVIVSKSDMVSNYEPIETAQRQVYDLALLAEAQKSDEILRMVSNAETTLDFQTTSEEASFDKLNELLGDLKEPITRSSRQLEAIQDGLARESRTRILKSISKISYPMQHKSVKKDRLQGSGSWLLQKPDYLNWRSESSSSVLWLHGIPGSGKTKLASLVIDELPKDEKVVYFYCMRTPAEPYRAECDKILACLVRQLASVSLGSQLLDPVVETYKEALEDFAEYEDQEWTTDESERVILALLGEYSVVTIVLDALDEVNYEDRLELLRVLSRLLQASPNLLKIFISSREDPDIVLQLEESPNIYIHAEDNASDIAAFM